MNSLNRLRPLVNGGAGLISRSYAFKSDLKIKWVRPEKIPCYKPAKSGDLVPLPALKGGELMKDFRQSNELDR